MTTVATFIRKGINNRYCMHAIASLRAAFWGWICGLVSIIPIVLGLGVGLNKAVIFILGMLELAGMYIFVWWLLFVLPLVLYFCGKNETFSPRTYTIFGLFYGYLVFLILINWGRFWDGTFEWPPLYLNIYALITGAVTGFLYPKFLMIYKIHGK